MLISFINRNLIVDIGESEYFSISHVELKAQIILRALLCPVNSFSDSFVYVKLMSELPLFEINKYSTQNKEVSP